MSKKKITIQDIAGTASVSKSTVSRVLNGTTPVAEDKRLAVMEAMKALDYKPNVFARSLAGGKTMTIGIVTENIGSPFYDSVTQGVMKGLNSTEYTPIIADGQWQPKLERIAISTLVDRQVDGLVMVGGLLDSEALDEFRQETPIVIVARSLPGWENESITIDNLAAAKSATNHLIENGHREIAHIMGDQTHQDAKDRYQGYKAAMREANLRLSDHLFVQGNFESQSGVNAIETLLRREKPFTAIFAANDQMAIGARLALYRANIRVPQDVSIIGFDNQSESAYSTPPLTTVNQPAADMGVAASRMLIGKITNKPVEIPTFSAELILRESVARID